MNAGIHEIPQSRVLLGRVVRVSANVRAIGDVADRIERDVEVGRAVQRRVVEPVQGVVLEVLGEVRLVDVDPDLSARKSARPPPSVGHDLCESHT